MKPSSQLLFGAVCLLSMEAASSQEVQSSQFKKVLEAYSQGKYQATVDELSLIEAALLRSKNPDRKTLGLVHYWKGMASNRVQNFAEAIDSFKEAQNYGNQSVDLNYEYGQALFAADKLVPARIQFSESFKKSFKRGACLYYMAFIAKDLGEVDNAKTLFSSVKKLPPAEAAETAQPAEMQLADMELEAAEAKANSFQVVSDEVIPVYESALRMNPESPLAPRIREKITSLQRKYELVLFQLRNGRPTTIPAHYLRLAMEVGSDSNVTFTPTETTVSKSDQASIFSKTEVMGRYTFYHKNFISVAPELRFNYSRYYNRIPSIYRNDNYLVAPAVRTTYEHSLFGKPASVLLDYDHNEAQRDVNAKERLEFSSRSDSLTLGERFTYFGFGQSTLRLRYRIFDSFLAASDSRAVGLVYEQTASLKNSTLIFYSSLDRTRTRDESFSTNAMTFRGDWLLPKYKEWFTPSVGLGVTFTDPVNNRKKRGLEKMVNPNVRLTRRFGKNWGTNFRLEHQRNFSKDEASFAFKKTLYGLELEYLF